MRTYQTDTGSWVTDFETPIIIAAYTKDKMIYLAAQQVVEFEGRTEFHLVINDAPFVVGTLFDCQGFFMGAAEPTEDRDMVEVLDQMQYALERYSTKAPASTKKASVSPLKAVFTPPEED